MTKEKFEEKLTREIESKRKGKNMLYIDREEYIKVTYSVEPEKGFTQSDIRDALNNGTGKLTGVKIVLDAGEGSKLMGTVVGQYAHSSIEWS